MNGLKLSDLKQYAGFIAARRTGANKGWVTLYLAEEQGIDSSDGGKYLILCEQHSTNVQVNNMRVARSVLRYPDFCEECNDHFASQ